MIDVKRLEEDIKKNVRNTVGYSESDDKREFMKGVEVALSLMGSKLADELEIDQNTIKSLKQQNKGLKKDLTTVSRIILKHAPNTDDGR